MIVLFIMFWRSLTAEQKNQFHADPVLWNSLTHVVRGLNNSDADDLRVAGVWGELAEFWSTPTLERPNWVSFWNQIQRDFRNVEILSREEFSKELQRFLARENA